MDGANGQSINKLAATVEEEWRARHGAENSPAVRR